MRESTHHYSETVLNPYHVEGDIWTHTMMVYNEAARISDDIHVHLAAMLHDIGKPDSRRVDDETKKVKFYNHENISTWYAIDMLKDFKEQNPDIDFDIVKVLLLINWHSFFSSHWINV